MDSNLKEKLAKIFSECPSVKLAYLFGSRANNTSGPISDYDFAIYLEKESDNFNVKLDLLAKLSKLLKSDLVDLVCFSNKTPSELKYAIIKEGLILFERNFARLDLEPKVLSEYFDYRENMVRHGLTSVS